MIYPGCLTSITYLITYNNQRIITNNEKVSSFADVYFALRALAVDGFCLQVSDSALFQGDPFIVWLKIQSAASFSVEYKLIKQNY